MRFVTHLIAADLRQHRVLISLWLVALVAATVVDGLHPVLGGEAAARNALVLLGWVLWIMKLIVRIVLVISIVQSHPLVGSEAFWLTRPIPRQTLLLAKTILLVTTVVAAPVIAEASLMVLHHVPLMTLVGVSADTALTAAALLAILMAAAAVTPTFSRFALLAAGTLGGLALFVAVGLALSLAHKTGPPGVLEPPGPADPTRGDVLFVMAVLAFVAVLLVQYETRSRVRTTIVAVAALAGALCVAGFWPWPVLEARVELPPWASARSSLQLVLDPTSVALSPISPDYPEWRQLVGTVDATGLDDAWTAGAGLLEATLQLGDGTVLHSVPSAWPQPLGSGTPGDPRGVIERVLGIRVMLGVSPRPVGLMPLLVLREQDLRNQEVATGHYQGRFHVRLTHYQIEATLPLRSGASGGRWPYQVVMDRASFAYGDVDVRLRETNASSSFDRRPRTQRKFFLRNPKKSEAVEGMLGDFDRPLPLPGLFGVSSFASTRNGFHSANIGLRFGPRAIYVTSNERGRGIDASWLQDAEVVVVTSTEEGAVERMLDIAAFPLKR